MSYIPTHAFQSQVVMHEITRYTNIYMQTLLDLMSIDHPLAQHSATDLTTPATIHPPNNPFNQSPTQSLITQPSSH